VTSQPHDGNGPRKLRPQPICQAGSAGHGLTAGCTAKATNGTPGSEPGRARLRIFVCGSCSTAEVVPWSGQAPDCGHPECADALARCTAPHQLDSRRFHGQVNFIMIERHLWDRYNKAFDEASLRSDADCPAQVARAGSPRPASSCQDEVTQASARTRQGP
jgi:hypothetical protein